MSSAKTVAILSWPQCVKVTLHLSILKAMVKCHVFNGPLGFRVSIRNILSLNWVIIVSGNSSLPIRCRTIIRNSAAYMCQWIGSALVQIMATPLYGAKPLPKPMLSIRPSGTNFNESLIKIQNFSFTKIYLKRSPAKWRPILSRGRWVNVVRHHFAADVLVPPIEIYWRHMVSHKWVIIGSVYGLSSVWR